MGVNKKYKNNINITKHIKSTTQREEEIVQKSDIKTLYTPKGINIDDIDFGVALTFGIDLDKDQISPNMDVDDYEILVEDKVEVVIDGNKIPVFWMTLERWGDFAKTWQFTNQDKNVPFPYIIMKRVDVKPGTYSGVKYSIPNRRKFSYIQVPTFKNNQYGYDIYKMPQPTPIDITYDLTFFTKYLQETNRFYEKMLKTFQGRQLYIKVNGHFFRIITEDLTDDNKIGEVNGDRFFMITNKIKIHAYLIDPDDIEVTEAVNRIKGNIKTNNETLTTFTSDFKRKL